MNESKKKYYMPLVEYLEKLESNQVELIYLKVRCANPDCPNVATDGIGNGWGIKPIIINDVVMVPINSQYCDVCAASVEKETEQSE